MPAKTVTPMFLSNAMSLPWRLNNEFCPSAATISLGRRHCPFTETVLCANRMCFAFQTSFAPVSSARRVKSEWSAGRLSPTPMPFGKSAATEECASQNRIPRKRKPASAGIATPSLRRTSMLSGISPSPQALSIGGIAESTTQVHDQTGPTQSRPQGLTALLRLQALRE